MAERDPRADDSADEQDPPNDPPPEPDEPPPARPDTHTAGIDPDREPPAAEVDWITKDAGEEPDDA